MRLIITLLLAALLAACESTASFNTQTGELKGMDSHDLANIVTNRDYVDGKIKQPQKAIVTMKAHPGQQITINAAEFTVWQPTTPSDDIRQAPQAKSAFVRNTEAVGGLVKDSTPAIGIAAALIDRKDARAAASDQAQIAAETERARDASQAAQSGELIEALREKPAFFVLPAGATPVSP